MTKAADLIERASDPARWTDELTAATLPALAAGMARAAAGQLMALGVDVRRRRKLNGAKHLPGQHDQGSHGHGGGGGIRDTYEGVAYDRVKVEMSHLDSSEQQQALERHAGHDGVVFAISLYGRTADVRMQAAAVLRERHPNDYEEWERVSLDAWALKGEEKFIRRFFGVHANGETGIWTTQMQHAMTRVGPNAAVAGRAAGFWAEGIRPPEPNPQVVTWLSAVYQRTQQAIAGGPETYHLYRGTDKTAGLPMESWAPDKKIARQFATQVGGTRRKGEVREAVVPRDLIFATYETIPGWDESSVKGKKEHIVLGTALLASQGKHMPGKSFVKSTASDWLAGSPDDLSVLAEMFDAAGVPGFDLLTELPEQMREDVLAALQNVYAQDYWADISRTTMGDAERILDAGLTEGRSVREMAKEIAERMGGGDYAKMRGLRIARTEAGNALNAARKVGMDQLQEALGPEVPMRPSWISVLGPTTRDSHAHLDGVPADKDGMWTLAGRRVPWPGHWSLPAGERCNCQCSVGLELGMREDEARELIAEYYGRSGEGRESSAWLAGLWRKVCGKHLPGQHDQHSHARGHVHTGAGETLVAVSRGGDKVWRTADGEPAPEHVQRLGIPPAWREVFANPDPAGDLMARGLDAKGRVQARYGDTHNARAAAAKFGRVSELRRKRAEILREVQGDLKAGRSPEEAAAAWLVMRTGMRPGGEADTGAKHKSYGATTLEGRHVIARPDGTAVIRFVPGKKHGQEIEMPVGDRDLAAELLRRAKSAGPDGRLFATSARKLGEYSRTKDGGGFKTKDHRTALGTETAIERIRSMPAPKNSKEYKAAVKAVATAVSGVLGNTPSIALKAYIDPQVWAGWRHTAEKTPGSSKHLAGRHDQSTHGRGGVSEERLVAREELSGWEGARKDTAEMALAFARQHRLFVKRDDRGVAAVMLYQETKYPGASQDVLQVLATREPGHGAEMLARACRMAAENGKGLALHSLPGAVGFYEKAGMRRDKFGKDDFYFDRDDAVSFADRVLGEGGARKYDPSQPRDTQGRFGAGGAPKGGSKEPRTDADRELGKLVGMVASLQQGNAAPRGWSYGGLDDMVSKLGVYDTPAPLPSGMRRGKAKECFMNAYHLATSGKGMTYVEGYATPEGVPLPIHHAWVVDRGGRVVDNTWKEPGTSYFGVHLSEKFLLERAVKTRVFGVFSFPEARDLYERGLPDGAVEG